MALGFANAFGRHENESSKRQKSNNGQDIVSNLPDDIIGSILSCLPAKAAVRTCVLSKRWKNLWTFVTEFSFQDRESNCKEKINKTRFIHSVYRVLFHLNTINSFSLSIHLYYDRCHLNEWISIVSSRKVKKICFESLDHCFFPSNSLFKCQTLEELCLKYCYITVPPFINLSSLTSLKLSGIAITCCNPSGPKDLTFNFPVLRKFETQGCPWSNVQSVTFQVPLLESVSLDYGKFVRSNAKIKFCASRLTSFCYTGSFLSDTILVEAVHIVSADIVLYGSSKNVEETRLFVSKLLSINAASLKLCLRKKTALQRVKHSLNDIPNFQILGHLDLDIATGDFLSGLLSKSPCLETLSLKVQSFRDTPVNSTFMPGYFLFTLKRVRFNLFAGTKHELNFAKFVMKYAIALEKITFFCSERLHCGKKLEKVKEKISSYKKWFSSVVIEYLFDVIQVT